MLLFEVLPSKQLLRQEHNQPHILQELSLLIHQQNLDKSQQHEHRDEVIQFSLED